MSMPKVLVTARSCAALPSIRAILRSSGFDILINPLDRPLREAELAELIPGVSGLLAGVDEIRPAVFEAGAPTLKIVARNGVGYDNIDLAAAARHGVVITTTPGANARSVADLAFGLLLAVARKIVVMDRSIRDGSWRRLNGVELDGKILGLIGMGNIGSEVAKRAVAFGMKVIAADPFPRPELTERLGVEYLTVSQVLAEADVISLHTPSTPATNGLINRAALSRMKPGVILINTARGELIVEDDLYDALCAGKVAGAGLDAYSAEPFTDPRFLSLPNVLMTPHAGGSTQEAINRACIMAVEEIIRVLQGKPPLHPLPLPAV